MRWRDVIWHLMHGPLKRTAEQIERMTMGEVALALDDDTQKRRGPEGFRPMNPAEMGEAARRRRSMTPRERIEAARRG